MIVKAKYLLITPATEVRFDLDDIYAWHPFSCERTVPKGENAKKIPKSQLKMTGTLLFHKLQKETIIIDMPCEQFDKLKDVRFDTSC